MTVEFPDLPPADVPPCETCGSPVRMKTVALPRTLADTVDRTTAVRVCTNRLCATNGRHRTLGDVV